MSRFKMPDTSGILSLLYTDTVNIARIEAIKDENNITTNDYQPKFKDIACKLSMSTVEEAADKDVADRPMNSSVKLFYLPPNKFQAGDKAQVFRNEEVVYEGYLGKPNIYHSHIEVDLSEELIK